MANSLTFLANIPIWVLPLFLALLWLGLRASKDRTVPVWLFYLLPFLSLIGLRNVLALPLYEAGLVAMACAFSGGAWAGWHAQKTWVTGRNGKLLQVRGEWWTMIAVMTLFGLNFANGVLSAVAPDAAQTWVFSIIYGGIAGASGGFFAGRALWVVATPRDLHVGIA